MGQKNDETIKALMAKIEAKKASLGTKPKISWKTNGLFRYDDNRHINLNTVNDLVTLVEALAFLYSGMGALQKAHETLGVSSKFTMEWRGFPMADWEADFKLKAESLVWEEENKKLKVLEAKLKTLVSEEARTEMELEDISKLLG